MTKNEARHCGALCTWPDRRRINPTTKEAYLGICLRGGTYLFRGQVRCGYHLAAKYRTEGRAI